MMSAPTDEEYAAQRQRALTDIAERFRTAATPEAAAESILRDSEEFIADVYRQTQLEKVMAQLGTIIEHAEEMSRFKGIETILAFIIDARYGGELTIDQAEFDRWVEAHPYGGHIEDTGPDDLMRLIVHHGTAPAES